MKKVYISTIVAMVMFALLFTMESNAQGFKKIDEVPHDISYFRTSRVTAPLVKVIYGRPISKEKNVFGNKIPYGKLWRTGANEATEIKLYQDVQFGDKFVKAGTYVLVTIPGEKEWEIILSANTDVWGAFQYDPSADIARIKVPAKKAEALKSFSIAFKKMQKQQILMVLGWGTTRVKIPLEFKQHSDIAGI